MFFRILAPFGSVGSLVGLIFSVRPPGHDFSDLEIALSVVGLFAIAIFFFVEIRHHLSERPRKYKKKKQIENYMARWISSSGKVAIFTRDMTWAQNDRMRSLLRTKAKAGELLLCVEKPIDLSESLKNDGANVTTYASLGHTPASRFTIINKDRDDAKVAVGGQVGNRHVIQEFERGKHPFFAVANDLVQVIHLMQSKLESDET